MSGKLTKQSRRSSTSYWFVLRNDLFAYYNSSTEVYFPTGTIDLRYAIKAELAHDDQLPSKKFYLVTEKKTYTLKAESATVAHSWVQALQKEIFRSRNEGDQVKIKIPIANIIDLEESILFDIVDTINIKAIDSDETYSIDDYVLAFLPGSKSVQLPAETIRKSMERVNDEHVSNEDIDRLAKSRKNIGKVLDSTTPPGSFSPGYSPGRERSVSPGGSRISSLSRRVTKRFSTLGSLVSFDSLSLADKTNSPKESKSPSDREIKSSLSELDSNDSSFADVSDQLKPAIKLNDNYDSDRKKRKQWYTSAAINKVTELWMGGTKHFDGTVDEDDKYLVPEEDRNESNERFRSHFSLGDSEELVASYYAHIQKAIPIYGKIYVSRNYVCFRSLLPGTRTKMILPVKDVENVSTERGFRFGYSGMVIVIHGHEEIFFEFGLAQNRDDAVNVILKQLDMYHHRPSTTFPKTEIERARLFTYEDALGSNDPKVLKYMTSDNVLTEVRDLKPLKFVLLTIGSRGDVQPYIALAKGLMAHGHKVKIASHSEFRKWVEGYGIEYAEIAGDPGELMKIMIEHGMFSVSFIRDAASKFRSWIDDLLMTSWEACIGADVLVESPSAMAGIHIAEALQIPYFRAFTMPWTRTRAYPHAFIVPEQKMGGSYNYLTYVLFDNVFWKGISGQVNRWRRKTLKIPKTSLDQMQQSKVPFLYNVSPSVFVPPVDFSDWISVTGYWFLDEGADNFKPPVDLADFIARAKHDNQKIVYIGFGSIVVSDSNELTRAVIESVQKAGVRCILSKGWSDRYADNAKGAEPRTEVKLPPEIFQIKSAPHDWLFPQLDAAVHHGGSGTTGASLRAGIPTIIKPFFGDQFFYAGRVEDLGVGIFLKKLNVSQFSKALVEATTNEKMIARAASIGQHIRSEHGVDTAIERIYREMDYAKSLIKHNNGCERRLGVLGKVFGSGGVNGGGSGSSAAVDEEDEENKTDDSWMVV
jgi:sterol 3beta-glucosyltransferase